MTLKDLGLSNVENEKRIAVSEYEGTVNIVNITKTYTIIRRAEELGINPGEVFVRVTVTDGDSTSVLSNKLKFIGQKDYENLIKAQESGTPVTLHITTYKNELRNNLDAFFYIVKETSTDKLFAQIKETEKNKSTVKSVVKRLEDKLKN